MSIDAENGIWVYECSDWNDFNEFITKRVNRTGIIWRGQRDSGWPLEPSLVRLLKKHPQSEESCVATHLGSFRYATRGRRGPNPHQIGDSNEDEWWALGQHHNLATPLLDWTSSPYAAAFFAYVKERVPKTQKRAVFGLREIPVKKKSDEISKKAAKHGAAEVIDFIRPMTDENQRLVSQSGLFTKSPLHMDIEAWITKHFHGETKVRLYKILLPESARETALKALNRMNINYLSLYPDLQGASLHCNMQLSITNY